MTIPTPLRDLMRSQIAERLNQSYRQVCDYIAAETDADIPYVPIEYTTVGIFDVAMTKNDGRPAIRVDEGFVELLMLYNDLAPSIGLDVAFRGEVQRSVTQLVFDRAVASLYNIKRVGLPPDDCIELLVPGYAEEYAQYLGSYGPLGTGIREASANRGKMDELSRATGLSASHIQQMGESEDHLRALAKNSQWTLTSCEFQFVWAVFHELGHLVLGHQSDVPSSRESEFEADSFATKHSVRFLDSKYAFSNALLTTAPIPCFFFILDFIEYIQIIANNCTRYALKDDFKSAHEPLPLSHPKAIHRLDAVLEEHRASFSPFNLSWASIFAGGLRAVKRSVYHGLIDLRHLKRFCRITAQQLTAVFFTQHLDEETRKELAGVIDIVDGWDSADLNQGPLVDEAFVGAFTESHQLGVDNQ